VAVPFTISTKTVFGVRSSDSRPDYPLGTLAERNDLFVGQVNETSLIEWEGLVRFNISGSVMDLTPGQPVRA